MYSQVDFTVFFFIKEISDLSIVLIDFNDISRLNQSEISNGIRNDLPLISDCLQRMVSSPDHGNHSYS